MGKNAWAGSMGSRTYIYPSMHGVQNKPFPGAVDVLRTGNLAVSRCDRDMICIQPALNVLSCSKFLLVALFLFSTFAII